MKEHVDQADGPEMSVALYSALLVKAGARHPGRVIDVLGTTSTAEHGRTVWHLWYNCPAEDKSTRMVTHA